MTRKNVADDYEKLMARARADYTKSIEAMDTLQRKVQKIKENPVISPKRKYYAKEVIKF